MKLNFGTDCFSREGSYMAFSYPQDKVPGYESSLTVRNIHGLFFHQDNYPICFLGDNEEKLDGLIEATETELVMTAGDRKLSICYQTPETVWLRTNCPAVMIKKLIAVEDRVMCHDSGTWEIAGMEGSLMFEVSKGTIKDGSVWSRSGIGSDKIEVIFEPGNEGVFECQMTLSGLSYNRPEKSTYAQALDAVKKDYETFKKPYRTSISEYEKAVEQAAYVMWHTIIRPAGYVKYPVILMSKNRMNQVWSWDYAINALAVVDKDSTLAYDQFLAMAACQDETGAYADCFAARTMIRAFVKPPVQGFMLRKMFRVYEPERDVKEKLYDTVARFTEWWFDYRAKTDGIPEYLHGNDSGWDNSTVFSLGLPVKSPDLTAWLVDQMDFLADLALDLGDREAAAHWRERSDKLLAYMLEYFVRDGRFVAYKIPENKPVVCDSLLLYVPLILGKRLPETLRQNMLKELLETKKFMTPYGLASEPLDSPYFVEDGYWRGAVWPPVAVIFTEILKINGKEKEAKAHAEGFCKICAKYGFYENYSAIDGHGLRDTGYTWTAAAFLILLRDYLENL